MSLQRIVLKVGTQVLVNSNGEVEPSSIQLIAKTISNLKINGCDVVLITSGAVGLGRNRLALKAPLTTAEKQASASVGQGLLMKMYQEAFDNLGLVCGQILVTSKDFSSRNSFVNLRETFETLIKFKVIPIVNENDSVSISEIQENEQHSFGDNDKLSSIVASKIGADLLILVTNVDGIYTKNPKIDPNAKRIDIIKDINELKEINTDGKSEMGRGGMSAKVESVRTASICGVGVLVTSSTQLEQLTIKKDTTFESLSKFGTVCLPNLKLKGKKKWIGTSAGFKAVIIINEGAKTALINRNASLLAVGVTEIKGDFDEGETLSLRDAFGSEICRGIAKISSEYLKQVITERALSQHKSSSPILVHRDDMAMFMDDEPEQ